MHSRTGPIEQVALTISTVKTSASVVLAMPGMALLLDLAVLVILMAFGLSRGVEIFTDGWAWIVVERGVYSAVVFLACGLLLELRWVRDHVWVMFIPAVVAPFVIEVLLPLMVTIPVAIGTISIVEVRRATRPNRVTKASAAFLVGVSILGLALSW